MRRWWSVARVVSVVVGVHGLRRRGAPGRRQRQRDVVVGRPVRLLPRTRRAPAPHWGRTPCCDDPTRNDPTLTSTLVRLTGTTLRLHYLCIRCRFNNWGLLLDGRCSWPVGHSSAVTRLITK